MKILQITAAYKPAYIYGGPTMSVAELSEQSQQAGCQVQVFTTTANGNEELNVPAGQLQYVDGVSIIYFNRLTKDHSHFSPALLKVLWREVKSYDVVHIHAWWNLVSMLSCAIAVWRKVPVIISPRGTLSSYSFQHRNSLLKKLMHKVSSQLLLKRCFIHTTSSQEETEMRQLTRFKGIFTLPNFVKLPMLTVSTKAVGSTTPLRLLFYSRIDAKKGLELLISTLPMLSIPYHLTIAGSGDEGYIDQLKAQINADQLQQYITWLSPKQQNKFTMLQQYDLMVLPSYNENFGNVVIESLSMGTAVLISKYVGLADYVSQHQLGWICDTDPKSIAEQIQLIDIQRQQLARISQQAPNLVRNSFTGNHLAQQYMSRYRNITSSGQV